MEKLISEGNRKMNKKVLIIEDDPTIAKLIAYNLSEAGYESQVVYNGEEGLNIALTVSFDIIIWDIMLPCYKNGYEILRKLRQRNIRVPVMLLTARDQEKDIVEGLEAGADDYMTKPFGVAEFLARVATVLRRSTHPERPETIANAAKRTYQVGELTVHPDKYEVEINGASIPLRPKEFEVLLYLAQRPGVVSSRDTLMNTVWGVDYIGGQRTVDVHVSSLRKKLELNQKSVFIENIRGVGYKLVISNQNSR